MLQTLLCLLLIFSYGLCGSQNLKLQLVSTYSGHSHGVRQVVFSPDGKGFASGSTRGEVFIWQVEGSGSIKKLEGHFGSVTDLRYSKQGNLLISAGEDGHVKVWDSSTGKLLREVVSPSSGSHDANKIGFAMLSPKGDRVFFGCANGVLCTAEFNGTDDSEVIYKDENGAVRCAALSPDGREVVFAVGKYLMAVDLSSGKVVREYNTGSCLINSLEFSEDGKRLLTWCENSRVDVRDPSNFYLMTSFRSGSGERTFSNMAFTDDQRYVVTVDHASRFNIWDLENSKLVMDQSADQGTIMNFDVKSGPNRILSASLDKSIKLWNIVEDVPEEVKPKKKPVPEPQTVEPQVEIVKYDQPVEDVPQEVKPVMPTNINVQLTEPEAVNPTTTEQESGGNSETIQVSMDQIVSVIPEMKNNRRVKPIRKEHKLVMRSHDLTFEIWDAQVVDGDIVSIYADETCIVKEYSLVAERKAVKFDASGYKLLYIYLHAHNLGTIPPNTVTMKVSDGINSVNVELRSDMTGSAALEIMFEIE